MDGENSEEEPLRERPSWKGGVCRRDGCDLVLYTRKRLCERVDLVLYDALVILCGVCVRE